MNPNRPSLKPGKKETPTPQQPPAVEGSQLYQWPHPSSSHGKGSKALDFNSADDVRQAAKSLIMETTNNEETRNAILNNRPEDVSVILQLIEDEQNREDCNRDDKPKEGKLMTVYGGKSMSLNKPKIINKGDTGAVNEGKSKTVNEGQSKGGNDNKPNASNESKSKVVKDGNSKSGNEGKSKENDKSKADNKRRPKTVKRKRRRLKTVPRKRTRYSKSFTRRESAFRGRSNVWKNKDLSSSGSETDLASVSSLSSESGSSY